MLYNNGNNDNNKNNRNALNTIEMKQWERKKKFMCSTRYDSKKKKELYEIINNHMCESKTNVKRVSNEIIMRKWKK